MPERVQLFESGETDRYLLEGSLVDGYLLEDGSGVYLLESDERLGAVSWSMNDYIKFSSDMSDE